MDLWGLNKMKVILTLWTVNYVDCVPFSCIDSFILITIKPTHFAKILFSNFEKHNQTSFNLTIVCKGYLCKKTILTENIVFMA